MQPIRQPKTQPVQRQATSYVAPGRDIETDWRTIMGFLKKRGINCSITRAYSTPAFYVYRLDMAIDENYKDLLKSLDDMERVLHETRLTAGRIGWDDVTVIRLQRKPMILEINRADPQPLSMGKLGRASIPFEGLIGMTYPTKSGEPVTWKFTEPDQAHLLIAGMTGSGKSTLLVTLLLDMCAATRPNELQLYLVDGGNADLRPLASLPHVAMYAGGVENVQTVIETVEAEMLLRKQNGVSEPRIMLVIEELGNLALSTEPKVLNERVISMSKIAQEGRKWGIHVIACTQKPNASIIGTFVKSNIGTRCCGVVMTKEDGNAALGVAGTGAERLPPKRGAFIYRSGQLVQSIQVPLIETPAMVVRRICQLYGAPVQTTKVKNNGFTGLAPVRTGAAPGQPVLMHHSAPVRAPQMHQAAPLFPLRTKRPLNVNESSQARRLAPTMSKNSLCKLIYGEKSSRYMQWLNEALNEQ